MLPTWPWQQSACSLGSGNLSSCPDTAKLPRECFPGLPADCPQGPAWLRQCQRAGLGAPQGVMTAVTENASYVCVCARLCVCFMLRWQMRVGPEPCGRAPCTSAETMLSRARLLGSTAVLELAFQLSSPNFRRAPGLLAPGPSLTSSPMPPPWSPKCMMARSQVAQWAFHTYNW